MFPSVVKLMWTSLVRYSAINLGYETDIIAAIASGLAGTIYGYKAISEEWRNV